MHGTILLNKSENTRQVENEEKSRFLRDLLEQIGVPLNGIWEADEELSVERRIRLRNLFATFSIQVIDDLDGNMKVFVDKECIAEWSKPLYKLKRDYSELDPKKQIFLEMAIKFWSVFETKDE
jgi:hypothetical protein